MHLPVRTHAAVYFAFASIIKNDVTYAKKARDMILYVMKQYMQNKGSVPFGQPSFATYDRSRWWGEAFPLTYDWVQYWPGVWTAAGKRVRTDTCVTLVHLHTHELVSLSPQTSS